MKTMSISKIALALLISVPALTLNCASVGLAAFTPKATLLGRLNDMTKKGCASLWAKTKSVFNTSVSYVQKNPKTVAKGAGLAAAALAAGYGAYRLGKYTYNKVYNNWFAPKVKKAAEEVSKEAVQNAEAHQQAADVYINALKDLEAEKAKQEAAAKAQKTAAEKLVNASALKVAPTTPKVPDSAPIHHGAGIKIHKKG